MANKQTINGFREEEIVTLRHWDKKQGEWVENSYPKVGGRLRLAHEQNETLAINTEVIRYDENIAVVAANVDTTKGAFHGIGMASVERDKSIAPPRSSNLPKPAPLHVPCVSLVMGLSIAALRKSVTWRTATAMGTVAKRLPRMAMHRMSAPAAVTATTVPKAPKPAPLVEMAAATATGSPDA